MKEVTCKYCNSKGLKELMIKHIHETDNCKYTQYFHENCFNLKASRDKAVDLFYEYTKSHEPVKKVYYAFNKIMANGLTEHDVYEILKYIIKQKKKLNYTMGILYYVDEAMKFINRRKENKLDNKVSSGIITNPAELKQYNKRNDNNDISDFL